MLVIIEGTDGVGKTTLANKLADRMREETGTASVIHKSAPKEHPIIEYAAPLAGYVPGLENIICDRWHLGELVYGPLDRGTSLDPLWFRGLEDYLQHVGALLVLCTERPARIAARLTERNEDVDWARIADTQRMFLQAFDRSWLPKLTYGAFSSNETTIDTIIDAANFREVTCPSS